MSKENLNKNLHNDYKKKLRKIISFFSVELYKNIDIFMIDPELFIKNWVDENCNPVSDYSKEEIINKVEEWTKESKE